jgi:hypothetical protein
VGVAIILESDLDPVGEARLLDASARVLGLRGRDRDARDPGTELASGQNREHPPTAADLEQPVAGPELDQPGQVAALGELRRLEIRGAVLEQGRGIEHRRIEPGGEEVVTEIVMGADVAACHRTVVGAQGVAQAAQQREGTAAVITPPEGLGVAIEELEQGHEIGAVPLARDVALGEPDAATQKRAPSEPRAVQLEVGRGPGLGAAQEPYRAVGQDEAQAPAPQRFQALDQAAEQEPARHGPGRGREALAGLAGARAFHGRADPENLHQGAARGLVGSTSRGK